MNKAMNVIKEAHNVERKRRVDSRKKSCEDTAKRTQKAKSLIAENRRSEMNQAEIMQRVEEMFGNGSGQENWNATTKEKIVERIEELSKREQQLDEWEMMRTEAKKRQREDRRLNLFWRKNRPSQSSLEEMKKLPMLKKRLTSGWRSATRR